MVYNFVYSEHNSFESVIFNRLRTIENNFLEIFEEGSSGEATVTLTWETWKELGFPHVFSFEIYPNEIVGVGGKTKTLKEKKDA